MSMAGNGGSPGKKKREAEKRRGNDLRKWAMGVKSGKNIKGGKPRKKGSNHLTKHKSRGLGVPTH
jgi:hypothetical protein